MSVRPALLLAALAICSPATAQPAAPAGSAATARELYQACRVDLGAYCSGVQPGGGRIGVCIRDNWPKLTSACQQTVLAMNKPGAAAPAAAAPAGAAGELSTRAQYAVRQACGLDIRQYCAGLPPGGGAVRQCMTENYQRFSTACQRTLAALRPAVPAGAPAQPAPATPPPG